MFDGHTNYLVLPYNVITVHIERGQMRDLIQVPLRQSLDQSNEMPIQNEETSDEATLR